MTTTLLFHIILAAVAVFAFIFGFVNLLKAKKWTNKGYFYSFSVLGFFGFAIGRIFCLLLELSGENRMVFSVGSLGIISGFLCMSFVCSTAQRIDEIDLKNPKKYKLIALVVPVFFVAGVALMLIEKVEAERMIIPFLLLISAMPCAYFCLTNIIAPYPKGSFMRSMRPYFITVLCFCVSSIISEMSWMIVDTTGYIIASWVLLAVGSACYIAIPILLERGRRKWIKT